MLANSITEGYLDAAGDNWHRMAPAPLRIRGAGANFIMECLAQEMGKAGGVDNFLRQHQAELAANNTARRQRYLRYKKEKDAKAKESKEQSTSSSST